MLRALFLERHLSHVQAAFYAVIAYFLFAASDTMAKFLMADGFERSVILIITSIPSLVIMTAIMIKRHGLKRCLYTPYKKLHIGRCLCLIGVTYFGFVALQHLPLANFYGMVFTTPLVITLGAFLFFKEKISLTEWAVIIIGLGGTLIIIQPQYGSFNIGYIYAFLGVLCGASAGLFVRKIGNEENTYLFVIFANIGIILANIIPAMIYGLPDLITLSHILIFAVYCAAIPFAILILSTVYARAPTVAAVASFQYTQIIWGTAFGFLIFNSVPDINTVIGSAIIISCGLYIIFHHKRLSKKALQNNSA
jgi:S-adenosylmethionine uptake transporter